MSDADSHPNITIRTNSEVTEILREGVLAGDVIGVVVGGKHRGEARCRSHRADTLRMRRCARKYDSRLSVDGRNTGVDSVTGDSLICAVDARRRHDEHGFHPDPHGARASTMVASFFSKSRAPNDIVRTATDSGKRLQIRRRTAARLTSCTNSGLSTGGDFDSSAIEANEVEQALESIQRETPSFNDTLDDLAKTVGVSADKLQKPSTVQRFVDSGIVAISAKKQVLEMEDRNAAVLCRPADVLSAARRAVAYVTDENAQVIDRRGSRFLGLRGGRSDGGVHGTERNGGCGWTECIGRSVWPESARAGRQEANCLAQDRSLHSIGGAETRRLRCRSRSRQARLVSRRISFFTEAVDGRCNKEHRRMRAARRRAMCGNGIGAPDARGPKVGACAAGNARRLAQAEFQLGGKG